MSKETPDYTKGTSQSTYSAALIETSHVANALNKSEQVEMRPIGSYGWKPVPYDHDIDFTQNYYRVVKPETPQLERVKVRYFQYSSGEINQAVDGSLDCDNYLNNGSFKEVLIDPSS